MDYKYAIVLKDDKVVVLRKVKDPDFIFEYCTKDRISDKLLYWNNIVNYNPKRIRKEEQEFLKRNQQIRKRNESNKLNE